MSSLVLWAALLLSGAVYFPVASATEQIPDFIEIDGESRPLFAEPFNQVLEAPERWQAFVRDYAPGQCSANWRGYQAYWSIRDAKLYLQRLLREACQCREEMPLDVFFPGQDAPVLADWYSGTLLIPLGQPGRGRHMGYSTEYERYWIVEVQNGQIVSRNLITHEELLRNREPMREQRSTQPHGGGSESP
ncbi:MAG: hypothetical protein LBV45_05240 [Xanthomonadaceae bacterium]|nr:hypothetical protein [Xanthomonadaceae bacterium]